MKFFGLDISRDKKAQVISLDQLIQRLDAAFETGSGVSVTPDTAMQSATVQGIVTAASRAIASLPVHVLQKTTDARGRTSKVRLGGHLVAQLLEKPNDWQSRVSYWLDATSWLVRYGNYFAFKTQGKSGRIKQLVPLHPSTVTVAQDRDFNVTYRVTQGGDHRELTSKEIHHVRGPARDGFTGDSPIMDIREAIALEIAAEKYGASFFGNGALPSLIFQYVDGFAGFKTEEEETRFLEEFQEKYSRKGRFRAMLTPLGLDVKEITSNNEQSQFVQARKHQRTVIAGAFGLPPHIVGDLERSNLSNIEQQSLDFVQKLVLPYARMFEAGMERDLLSDEERRKGIIIRFNLDGLLRGDFKTRQEGLKIQREMGAINPNEWREEEGRNPRDDPGGEEYWNQGPSGQGGQEPSDGNT